MFWHIVDEVLTPFNHAWEYLLVYVVVFWLVIVGLLRFGPRECPAIKHGVTIKESEWSRRGRFIEPVVGDRRHTKSECLESWITHWNHVVLRQYALVIAGLWPLVLYLVVPIIMVVLFFKSIYAVTHVKSIFPGEVE